MHWISCFPWTFQEELPKSEFLYFNLIPANISYFVSSASSWPHSENKLISLLMGWVCFQSYNIVLRCRCFFFFSVFWNINLSGDSAFSLFLELRKDIIYSYFCFSLVFRNIVLPQSFLRKNNKCLCKYFMFCFVVSATKAK